MSGQVPSLKHQRIADELARDIRDGRLRDGALLPGEHTLAARFKVSRNTVRQALSELSRRDLIATHSGKGSFVTFDRRELDDRLGWTRALAAQGIDSSVEVLRLEVVDEPDLIHRYGLPVASEFVAVDRCRRLTDGPVVSIERSRVPAVGTLRSLPQRGLDTSLYEMLFDEGLVPARGEEWAEVAPIEDGDAQLFGCSAGELYLHTRKLSRDRHGRFVEYVESWLDPRRFQLHLRFGDDSA
ncbi:GntR family transcriptional regulator [Mycobacterium sp. 3519A]|uniref:GntR family transcriptional regulator n=1 Tax=Mycobacterium sp. 3519A TaxID=2057184 RepID=UPI000C7D04FE|nr:GntR family transcriptional regulator [Mycobacterium sp. 3519A]